LVIIGDSDYKDSVLKKQGLEKEPQENYGGETCLIEYKEANELHCFNYLWLPQFRFTIDEYGALAHEILHCVINVFDKVNISICKSNSEPAAYYLNFLYCEIFSKLTKLYKVI